MTAFKVAASFSAAIGLLACNAFAYTATLDGGGLIPVPVTGTTLDLSVNLSQTAHAHDDTDIAAVQMTFVADAAGVSIVGIVGNAGSSGTGTRYNDPEWTADTSLAFSPNNFSGPMAPGVHKGVYGSIYNTYVQPATPPGEPAWNTASSLLGHLVVTLAAKPAGTIIHLSPADLDAADIQFNDVYGDVVGVTIVYGVPEPATALLLLAAFPLLRSRRITSSYLAGNR